MIVPEPLFDLFREIYVVEPYCLKKQNQRESHFPSVTFFL